MKILLATGIYPPAIGGPATYVEKLARQLVNRGLEVTVVTFAKEAGIDTSGQWTVERVSKGGGPLIRWNRYAKVLQKHAKNADIVECFSTVSVGMPLLLARLKGPKKILRLGGDFLWERYTDYGGRLPLRSFYQSGPKGKRLIKLLFGRFDHIIFSTRFQESLYQRFYKKLPEHSVIENALPDSETVLHAPHEPFQLLYMGRFVRFKNLMALIRAVSLLPHVRLTLAGEGPLLKKLFALVSKKGLGGRVSFMPPVHGDAKKALLLEHDLLVLPSLTDISPNAAIEARAAGMPVLLTEETGLSDALLQGMIVRPLRTSTEITRAVLEVEQQYEVFAEEAAQPLPEKRTWEHLVEEHLALFRRLL